MTPEPGTLSVEFCGEWTDVAPERSFIIGRDADLSIDENQYLHRRFLELSARDGLWWIRNLGGQLSATISDGDGRFQAWLAPGGHLPLVFDTVQVRFTAGTTTYELSLHLTAPPFSGPGASEDVSGATTLGRVSLHGEQLALVLALAEPALLAGAGGRNALPTSAVAATRLGWSITKFNRKLDAVCQKLERAGVQGLHGDLGALASDRRARLVEYALAVRLVTAESLDLLERYVSSSSGTTPQD
jgi:hypothetical protein